MKIPVVSLAILGLQAAAANATGQDLPGKLGVFVSYYTGVDFNQRKFAPEALLLGYGPWLVKRFLLPIARPRISGMHLPVSIS